MTASAFTKELVQETTASVLADCAFLMLDPAPELGPPEGTAVETTLPFNGQTSGVLRLCATQQLLLGAVGDMIGQTPGPEHATEEAEATLAELANVLLGVLLARVFGARDCPVIGLPQSRTVPAVSEAAGAVCSAVLVDMAGQSLVVSILRQAEEAA